MISLTNYFIFLFLPLLVFAITKARLYKQLFGILIGEPDKKEAFASLVFSSLLLLLMPSFLILDSQSLSPIFFMALVYAFHLLYISLDSLKAKNNKALNINFAILLFLSLLDRDSTQIKYLTMMICFIIIFNRVERPSRLVEFIFVSYEALFLSFVFALAFFNGDSALGSLTFVGFFALCLLFSVFKFRPNFFLTLSKLSCMVFIVYLLYLSTMIQWNYWF
jgi:hypothetical protein